MNLNARLAKIESALPAPKPPDPFAGRDKFVQTTLAQVALNGAQKAFEAGEDARAGGAKTYHALLNRLRAEALDWGPLDDTRRNRVREIAEELDPTAFDETLP